ncbi:MAG TPA: N-acetylmuramic acid 6-phosphate etherase [Candidatus Dormibacteraeota bacterium]|nr:N-acetylmuramic acid 6-phosphate etherase [Candidatus Dormibacteraeota bacterium]
MSEKVHPRADDLDAMSTLELVTLMNAEDANAVDAVRSQLPSIAEAVDAIADRLRAGGRLHYFGAGTSGLIAALDAAECPATFGVAAGAVQAHAVTEAGEEDDRELGVQMARDAGIKRGDVVVGISASGHTPFVLGALRHAGDDGAFRIAVTCRPGSQLASLAHVAIEIDTGPEVIAGSTRLKAGTAQKLVLNMLTTGAFTRLGRTRRGRMVGVVAGNQKLRDRAARIVSDLAGVSLEEARRLLDEAGGDVEAVLSAEPRV